MMGETIIKGMSYNNAVEHNKILNWRGAMKMEIKLQMK